MPTALFSWETRSIAFKYGILPDSNTKLWADDPWLGNASIKYIMTSIMVSNIDTGS